MAKNGCEEVIISKECCNETIEILSMGSFEIEPVFGYIQHTPAHDSLASSSLVCPKSFIFLFLPNNNPLFTDDIASKPLNSSDPETIRSLLSKKNQCFFSDFGRSIQVNFTNFFY